MASEVEFDDRIPEIVVELPLKSEQDQMAIAQEIADAAYRGAPRLNRVIITPSFYRTPGWMASSIEVEEMDGESVVFVGAFIGHFVEHGTENMRARPFLQPAAIANEPELIGQVKHTLERL